MKKNYFPDSRNKVQNEQQRIPTAVDELSDCGNTSLFAGQKGEGVNHNSESENIVIFSRSFVNINMKKHPQYKQYQSGERIRTLYGDGDGARAKRT